MGGEFCEAHAGPLQACREEEAGLCVVLIRTAVSDRTKGCSLSLLDRDVALPADPELHGARLLASVLCLSVAGSVLGGREEQDLGVAGVQRGAEAPGSHRAAWGFREGQLLPGRLQGVYEAGTLGSLQDLSLSVAFW